jgi:hypothetical protein
MVITEEYVRRLVESALNEILGESTNMSDRIGKNGPIKDSNLEDPAIMFKNEWEEVKKIIENGKRVKLEKIFKDTFAYKIWKQYYNAMMSKEGKKALGFISWMKYVCNGKFAHKILAYNVGDNYIFGLWSFGFFVTVYLAPSNVVGLYKLISSLCEYSNIVFPVTEDLSKMLEKLGVKKSDEMHDARWRGKTIQKNVFGTSPEAINHGVLLLNALSVMR